MGLNLGRSLTQVGTVCVVLEAGSVVGTNSDSGRFAQRLVALKNRRLLCTLRAGGAEERRVVGRLDGRHPRDRVWTDWTCRFEQPCPLLAWQTVRTVFPALTHEQFIQRPLRLHVQH